MDFLLNSQWMHLLAAATLAVKDFSSQWDTVRTDRFATFTSATACRLHHNLHAQDDCKGWLFRKLLFIHREIYLITWSRLLLYMLPVAQLLETFPTYYGSQRFIVMFTRSLHWPLSWAKWIQSIAPLPLSVRSILISSHLCLCQPSSLFPSGFPIKTRHSNVSQTEIWEWLM
jgi:hypothetical protein